MARQDSTAPAEYCRAFWGFAFSPIEETDPTTVARLAGAMCDDEPDALRAREGLQRRFFSTIGTWNWVDSISRFTAPTLVVVGDAAPALIAGARAWAGRLPEGRLLLTGGSGLFPWVASGREVRAAIGQFLDGRWPEGGERVAGPPDVAAGRPPAPGRGADWSRDGRDDLVTTP